MVKKNQKKRINFQYEAPDAGNVSVVSVAGSFNNWSMVSHPLKRNGNGKWQKTIYLEPGVYEYRFVVDGAWYNDPRCAERRVNDFGSENCVLTV